MIPLCSLTKTLYPKLLNYVWVGVSAHKVQLGSLRTEACVKNRATPHGLVDKVSDPRKGQPL